MTRLRQLLGDYGATATEFALLLPALLLFLMLIMEGGRVLAAWVILTNESRDAARYGAAGALAYQSGCGSPPASACQSAVQSKVHDYAVAQVGTMLDTAPLNVNVTVQMNDNTPVSVQVVCKYSVAMVTPLMQAFMASVPVNADAVMKLG